ncbi:MAG: hypothetical protein AB2A00_23620 [Myxococcota bacterium]
MASSCSSTVVPPLELEALVLDVLEVLVVLTLVDEVALVELVLDVLAPDVDVDTDVLPLSEEVVLPPELVEEAELVEVEVPLVAGLQAAHAIVRMAAAVVDAKRMPER